MNDDKLIKLIQTIGYELKNIYYLISIFEILLDVDNDLSNKYKGKVVIKPNLSFGGEYLHATMEGIYRIILVMANNLYDDSSKFEQPSFINLKKYIKEKYQQYYLILTNHKQLFDEPQHLMKKIRIARSNIGGHRNINLDIQNKYKYLFELLPDYTNFFNQTFSKFSQIVSYLKDKGLLRRADPRFIDWFPLYDEFKYQIHDIWYKKIFDFIDDDKEWLKIEKLTKWNK